MQCAVRFKQKPFVWLILRLIEVTAKLNNFLHKYSTSPGLSGKITEGNEIKWKIILIKLLIKHVPSYDKENNCVLVTKDMKIKVSVKKTCCDIKHLTLYI